MKAYVIKFIDGYYAEKQPHYRWSFTKDIYKAKLYKTKRNAEKQIWHGDSTNKINYHKGTLFEIDVRKKITINIVKEAKFSYIKKKWRN